MHVNVDTPQNLYRMRNLPVSANYNMFPLQNQEPVIAYPCRHLGCPKKWFWRTPGGPDNGVAIFGGILKAPVNHEQCGLTWRKMCAATTF